MLCFNTYKQGKFKVLIQKCVNSFSVKTISFNGASLYIYMYILIDK